MKFRDKLAAAWKANNSLVCVGLDPEPRNFPDRFRDVPGGIFEFNKAIVDATRDLVCAYKPQFAHYAANTAENQLEHTIDYIKTRCPDAIAVPVPDTDYYPRAFGCNGETGIGARIRSWLDDER